MAMAGAFVASRAFGTSDGSETPLVRFGLVTDLHYADKAPSGSGATARHYRDSLPKLAAAVEDFNRRDHELWFEKVMNKKMMPMHTPSRMPPACEKVFHISSL